MLLPLAMSVAGGKQKRAFAPSRGAGTNRWSAVVGFSAATTTSVLCEMQVATLDKQTQHARFSIVPEKIMPAVALSTAVYCRAFSESPLYFCCTAVPSAATEAMDHA